MDIQLSYQTLVTVGIFVATLAAVYIWQEGLKRKKLPPGPWSFPVFGYHPFLGDEPHLVLAKLKDKYGPIMGLKIGTRYCVVLSDFKSIKESYNKPAFLGRPPNYFRVSAEHTNIAEMNGKDWEEQRKFAVNTLKALGMGKNRLEEILLDEISRLIPKFETICKNNEGRDLDIRDLITPAINNAIFQLICSRWFEDDHPAMKTLILFQNLAPESFLNTSAVIYFPWFKWFLLRFNSRLKHIWAAIHEMENYIKTEIELHKKNHTEGSNGDYIDFFLTEMQHSNGKTTFTSDILATNAVFLMQAGSETVRNTLEWAFLCMAEFPEVQDKVYQEITAVLGRDRIPNWEDRSSLPFTEAVIYETERWKTLVVLNCLRWTDKETKLRDFVIPKGTVVINNLWACHMDPDYWEKPNEFKPDRFLSRDKKKAVIPEYFMPFSLGKRDCPGDKMAIMEVFLYFTAIIQRFRFNPPDGGVSFDHLVRINVHAKKPVAKITPRQ